MASTKNYGIIRQDKSVAKLQAIPLPPLEDDYILVETVAVAINPTDWTTLDAPGATGTLVGCDYAGTVIAIGSAVTKAFKIGDRVCGMAHGGNDSKAWTGAFARVIAVKGDLQLKIPDDVSWEAASTIGVAMATSGWALWKELELSMPQIDEQRSSTMDQWVLIYGGSTATGTIAIQLASLSGYKVITTASPKHFDLLRKRGADAILDYRAPDVGTQINQQTGNRLSRVLDCVITSTTAAICAEAFGSEGGIYCTLLPMECSRDNVKSIFFLSYSLSGEEYIFEGDFFEARPEMFAFGKEFVPLIESLWRQGKLQLHPQRVEEGGLIGALDGMEQMKAGKVSGVKLVYRVADTLWPED